MIDKEYFVQSITKNDYESWLLHKHYAHRIPSISYAFGLYTIHKKLQGICTFGSPCRYYNDGEFVFVGHRVKTLELNRLVVAEDLPKNTLSWFVSKCFSFLPKPLCIVSYSDNSKGHHGYIYQATNWFYTGLQKIHDTEYIVDGKEVHSRTLTGRGITAPKEWAKSNCVETIGGNEKHRYFMFLGTRQERKKMNGCFRFQILPYPKGENKRYDASYQPKTQDLLF